MSRPFIVGVGGYSSNVGKTTLMCELLRAFPGWEAIKTTRGHYRSCGKDPMACCVSHLLSDAPLIRSGREETFEAGKDTGKYWEAGASNVHWLIATDNQIGPGIKEVLKRVKSEGVLIEGNSFSKHIRPDFFVMVKRQDVAAIKRTAQEVMSIVSAIFESGSSFVDARETLKFNYESLPLLIDKIRFESSLQRIE